MGVAGAMRRQVEVVDDDILACCVHISPTSDVKDCLAVPYRKVLYLRRLREAVGPEQGGLLLSAVVALVQVYVKN